MPTHFILALHLLTPPLHAPVVQEIFPHQAAPLAEPPAYSRTGAAGDGVSNLVLRGLPANSWEEFLRARSCR